MKTILHKADTRGHANHGWLDSHHTFSFASYYEPSRVRFGLLRVLNDDVVAGGMGFATHPHDNMEIISIPLSGSLEHQDDMGNKSVIKTNDVQIMSAGTGVTHSEKNHSHKEKVNFLQIWVFPEKQNIAPRYEQKTFDLANRKNKLVTVVSPKKDDGALWINQKAWFSLGNISKGESFTYSLNEKKSGVYVFVIEGEVKIESETLSKRDGMGIMDADAFSVEALAPSEILLMEVPME